MKFPLNTFGLLLASLALASCGGGGGNGGAASAPQSGSITLTTSRPNLPLNPGNVLPYPGSPYMAEVQFTYRNNAGVITALTADATFVTSSPNTVCLIQLDDPSTDENELEACYGTFHSETNNGSYVFFVGSSTLAGTATVTASAIDPATGRTVSKTLTFTVAGSTPLPASLTVTPSPSSVYIPGSGGSTNSIINILVRDGANQPVPNPGAADNVQVEIVGNAGGSILSATSVNGPNSGPSVKTSTINGVASASFQAGTVQGPIQVRATVDRADNNVSNGIADPISATTTVVVSDGKLFSLTLSSPNINSLRVNRLSDGVVPPDDLEPPDENGVPPDPDASYSLTISALAKDRQGSPVVPGTVIRFGVIDEPFNVAANRFSISGNDGNPLEGGNLFTAPTGQFLTAGGGAGPGDALVVFGSEVQGNSDLESALTVQTINSQTNLNTASNFNRNNTTGVSVDYGSVLPYVIARAQHGNITPTGVTNDIGLASATLNYTVSTLGFLNVIWAQGESVDPVTGGTKRVTDAEYGSYPGLAPGTITVSPSPIIGNRSQQVRVCLYDATLSPLQRVRLGFSFELGQGTGSVDGTSGAGLLGTSTGADGCAIANVVTSGLGASTAGAPSGVLTFSLGGLSASVDIIVNLATLQVSPSFVQVSSTAPVTRTITITARDTSGSPVSGVQITGTCTAPAGATIAPAAFSGITGASGSTQHTVTASIFPVDTTGICTYTTPQGLSGSVTFGTSSCGFSPCD